MTPKPTPAERVEKLFQAIGGYGVQVSETKELAPDSEMVRRMNDIQRLAAELEAVRQMNEELADELEDSVNQACRQKDGTWDSMAMSANASGILLLEKVGRCKVTHRSGRRVIAIPTP